MKLEDLEIGSHFGFERSLGEFGYVKKCKDFALRTFTPGGIGAVGELHEFDVFRKKIPIVRIASRSLSLDNICKHIKYIKASCRTKGAS